MKKFISMVMAAAMVVSLVPATAFAKTGDVTATAKIVDAWEKTKDFDGEIDGADVPEVQLKVKDVDYQKTNDGNLPEMKITYTLDNADFLYSTNNLKAGFKVMRDGKDVLGEYDAGAEKTVIVEAAKADVAAALVKQATAAGEITAANHFTDDKATVAVKVTPDHYVGEVKTPGKNVNDVLKALVGDGNVDKLIVNNGRYEAKEGFTAAGTDTNTYAKGDVVVYVAEVEDAVVEEVLYTKAEVEADILTKLTATKYYTKDQVDAPGFVGDAELYISKVELTDKNEVEVTFKGCFEEDDIISFDLRSQMDKTSEGRKATVSVESDMVDADDLVYASILGHGITASTKKLANVAEEEKIELEKDLKIKSNVGKFVDGQVFELKLSKGFEFDFAKDKANVYDFSKIDDNVVYMEYLGADDDEITIDASHISIEATTAKSGATATLTVKALKDRDLNNKKDDREGTFSATTTVEVAKVVDYKVVLSVDEDEDVPVIYSGVNVDNYGITDDSDHVSLEVTAEETFPGAWSMRKGFNFELPEGVYVTDVDVTEAEYFYLNGSKGNDVDPETVEAAFWNAYQDGSHVNFEFEKRVFDDVDSDLRDKECATMTFTLTLVADPTFEGDVVLKLTGDLVDEQEVTIAKFVKPYTVKAEQNDLKIDYRNTEIPTAITITEAEAGLWAKDEAEFRFAIDRGDMINFEDDATFEVDKDSELEVDDFTREKDGVIGFEVDAESDEAATVTIKDMRLFMQRNIPAGPYDLTIGSSLADAYEREVLFAPDDMDGIKLAANGVAAPDRDDYADDYAADWKSGDRPATKDVDEDTYVADVCDYSDVVKAAFVNVITGGRDKDDASFTTKVVVPVGESYIISGENQVALDVPAYVSAAGYTMLPVRAVAVALGIDTQNVLWNQPTRTVTILYGQRIITMTAGQKVVYVNGSAIPASASVEITNGRTFLPMRDLATALGVTDITWDAATKTATLNGSK